MKHNFGNTNLNKLLLDKKEFESCAYKSTIDSDRNTLKNHKKIPKLSPSSLKKKYWAP